MTIYRGFDIRQVSNGYVWTDEEGNQHGGERGELPSEAHAMDSIDAYKRAKRRQSIPAGRILPD